MNLNEEFESHKKWLKGSPDSAQIDISDCVIKDQNLCNADINSSIYNHVKFENVLFNQVNLGGADFFNCRFYKIQLNETNIRKCEFDDCNMSKSEFNTSKFQNSGKLI